jgi:hypothetical protein
MKPTLTATLVALALLGAGSAVLADDAMMAKPATAMGTMVCRPAKSGETANAMTSAKADLVCKPLDTKAIMAMQKPVESMTNGPVMWQALLSDLTIHDVR